MDFILNHLHFEFSFLFFTFLVIVYLINFNLKILFKNSKKFFYVQYIAIWIHESCHYLAALVCLKIPKFNQIKIERHEDKLRISWSVQVKVYTYKELIYHIIDWDKVTATIFLIWELFSWFVIWLAPIIFPFLFVYFFLLPENNSIIITWENIDLKAITNHLKEIMISIKIFLFIPIFSFLALVSSVSKEDIKNALPWVVLLTFIPFSDKIFTVLIINISLMWVILLLGIFINIASFWRKQKSYNNL